tara:strand:+ start:421 stop:1416 length:996 start_codon:yes stop_codon:yes gene_type:complete
MVYKKILKDIDKNIISPVYLLYGEEDYFIDLICDKLVFKIIDKEEKKFDLNIFYGKDSTIEMIIECVKKYPMISDKNVVVIKEAHLLKSKLEKLNDYIKRISKNNILIICYKENKIDKRKEFYKLIDKEGIIFQSNKLFENQLVEWIKNRVYELGYKINYDSIKIIYSFLGNNLNKIENELKKLIITIKPNDLITKNIIHEKIGLNKDYNFFELQKALGRRDLKTSLKIIDFLKDNLNKNPLVLILPTVFNYFQKILMIKCLGNNNLSKELNISSYFLNDYIKSSKNFSLNELIKIVNFIKDADFKNKGINSKMNQEDILKELAYKIVRVN